MIASSTDWLRQNGLRVTAGRRAMVDVLLKTPAPLALAELHRKVSAHQCDFATVFRFMTLLEKKKKAQSHSWKDRVLRYELVRDSEDSHHHHHHLICQNCHQVEEIDSCAVTRIEQELARKTGYAEVTHSLEFFGICPDCQEKPAARAKHK